MRWDHLNLEEGRWNLPGEFTKNKVSHLVPLSAPVVAILKGLKARRSESDGGWVLRGRRLGRPYTNLGHATDALRQRSGIDFKPHDLRRTAATLMGRAGVSRFIIEKVLNHKDASVTGVYDRHEYEPEKRAALEALAEKLAQIIGRPVLKGLTDSMSEVDG